ncbi:acetyl-CoA C-acyltransferase [Saprospiraceae bacterium]|nr:acetyl-CoA C-acyltransferase [Saprospiraceae bacterium]
MNKVYIVSAVRTPQGSFGGVFSGFSATELGSFAIKGAIEKAGVSADKIQEVFMGNVCQANLGQAPARQAALGAGVGMNVPATTVNKVCASGMKSIMFASQSIMLGMTDLAVAGGMESMSNIPFYLPNMRWGKKYGAGSVVDGLEKDGLQDAYNHKAMGLSADLTATKFDISREEQDEYAIRSYKLAAETTDKGMFADEIVPVSVPQRKKDPIVVSKDEEYSKVMFEKIPTLRPAFNKDGTATAANSSTLNDGASAIILASEKAIKEYGLTPIAEVVSFADAAQEPEWFTTAPTLAAPLALERAGLKNDDIAFWEVNEAFSVVPLAFNKELGIDGEKVNVFGGGVSLGHPLGSSGSRIVSTLVNVLGQKSGEFGCATLCNGGGGASAMVIKKM